jgi:hypothetical protein
MPLSLFFREKQHIACCPRLFFVALMCKFLQTRTNPGTEMGTEIATGPLCAGKPTGTIPLKPANRTSPHFRVPLY